jgi:hypothetical protein
MTVGENQMTVGENQMIVGENVPESRRRYDALLPL